MYTIFYTEFTIQFVVVIVLSSADVLSEDAILKWYNDGKGRGVLLEQLKPFVEWLKQAEEGRLLADFACGIFQIYYRLFLFPVFRHILALSVCRHF